MYAKLLFWQSKLIAFLLFSSLLPSSLLKLPIVYLKGTSKTPLTSEQEMYNTPGLMPALKMTAIY